MTNCVLYTWPFISPFVYCNSSYTYHKVKKEVLSSGRKRGQKIDIRMVCEIFFFDGKNGLWNMLNNVSIRHTYIYIYFLTSSVVYFIKKNVIVDSFSQKMIKRKKKKKKKKRKLNSLKQQRWQKKMQEN